MAEHRDNDHDSLVELSVEVRYLRESVDRLTIALVEPGGLTERVTKLEASQDGSDCGPVMERIARLEATQRTIDSTRNTSINWWIAAGTVAGVVLALVALLRSSHP